MNKDDVCSLEYAKKLSERGVQERSDLSYILSEYGLIDGVVYKDVFILTDSEISKSPNKYSAFTTSQLLNLMPFMVDTASNHPFNCFRFNMMISRMVDNNEVFKVFLINYHCDTIQLSQESPYFAHKLIPHNIFDRKAPDALAKTLIYLLENKLYVMS